MRTAASEHLNHAQVMSRLSATFSALIKEQIEVVRRYLDSEHVDLESSEMGPIVDLAVRLVERSAEWLELTEVANLARELRETLSQLDQLRPTQRQEMVAHCNVALEAESKLAEQLRTDGFGALLAHAGTVGDAVDSLRNGMTRAKAQAMAASRGVIDEATPEVGPHENLLALTFEIKSALVHQNERIASMNDTLDSTLRSLQSALSDWELHIKGIERKRMSGQGSRANEPPDPRTLTMHTQLQDAASGLRSLSHEMNHLLGLQYSLERRARDLDEHLLWEFLDPLDRFVDDMYQVISRRADGGRTPILTVHTGGVGFEPEIGSILLPLVLRLLETAKPSDSDTGPIEIRVNAAREGLEARLAIEGFLSFDEPTVAQLESALEGLGGFVHLQGGGPDIASLRIQFPMARSLRSFLIVEAAGQRIALPWSAVERIHATEDELQWSGSTERGPIHPLGALFSRGYLGDPGAGSTDLYSRESSSEEDAKKERGRPLAILRCGGGAVVVGFDRIVWRENARLTQLPPRLCPVDEVLGGIVSPDSNVILVLNPGALIRRLKQDEQGVEGKAE
ncbi:MAG: hypothetical protein ACRENN_07215 [Candidatus Eiseniibacteriota bacterium]